MVFDWVRQVYPPRTLAITLAITVIVWFAGPFGTFEAMDPLFRLVYWGVLILGAVPLGYAVRRAVTRRWAGLSLPINMLTIALLFSTVYTPVVYLVTRVAHRFVFSNIEPIWTMWGGTFLAAACAYAVRALLIEQEVRSAAPEPGLPRLLHRIEEAQRGPLLAISVRDHYVDVRTARGKASLLMRLSDAISETEGVSGAQVHRSHWVAWEAVEGVDRRGGNLVLRLVDGAAIPVSRNHRDKLEERGLI